MYEHVFSSEGDAKITKQNVSEFIQGERRLGGGGKE